MASREAAAAFEEACWERSFELREESASCVHRTVKAAELAHATGSATQLCMRSGSMLFVNTSRDPPPLGLGPTDPRGFESRAPARTAARSALSPARSRS